MTQYDIRASKESMDPSVKLSMSQNQITELAYLDGHKLEAVVENELAPQIMKVQKMKREQSAKV